MKRLCIYVTYDRKAQIKPYVGYMLRALRPYVSRMCVVCNYPQVHSGREYLEPYADSIYCRDNKGYDAGAYKDALCSSLGWEEVRRYDELILMNDSFLGPLYDLGEYFALMEHTDCDFWGMTRNFGGEYTESFIGKFGTHIQSYFLVFFSGCFHSLLFQNYWERLVYPKTYDEAIFYFEHAIYKLLTDKGFVGKALTDVWGLTFAYNENPYRLYGLELIRDKKLPILKKKALLVSNAGFANTLQAAEYIEANGLYPEFRIWDFIDDQFEREAGAQGDVKCLGDFINRFRYIYIYGAGVCARNLMLYLDKKYDYAPEGLLVSDTKGQDMPCVCFSGFHADAQTGIIISPARRKAAAEIAAQVEKRFPREQMFVLADCPAIGV